MSGATDHEIAIATNTEHVYCFSPKELGRWKTLSDWSRVGDVARTVALSSGGLK